MQSAVVVGLLAVAWGGCSADYELVIRTEPDALAEVLDVATYCPLASCADAPTASRDACGVIRRTGGGSTSLDLPSGAHAVHVELLNDDCSRRALGCTGDLSFGSGGGTVEVVAFEVSGGCAASQFCCSGRCVAMGDACAPPDAGRDGTVEPGWVVTHLRPEDSDAGAAPLTVEDSTIDTDALTIDGSSIAGGNAFEAVDQVGGGGQVAVLRVASLEIRGTVVVVGSRPLLIVAEGEVRVAGLLDLAATGATPGAGGFLAGLGRGAGTSSPNSPGAGGAGHLQPGARSGTANDGSSRAGGDAVASLSSPPFLLGGAGGGDVWVSSDCDNSGGGGGGALQISTRGTIVVTGTGAIDVGGGGGTRDCAEIDPGGRGGAGGGAGGMLYLQASQVVNNGILVANGGGGASAGGQFDARAGEDGTRTVEGASGGSALRPGGTGGARAGVPTPGGDGMGGGITGGGGGGAGPIYIEGVYEGGGTISPEPIEI